MAIIRIFELYDFCLDFQMGCYSYEKMKEKFINYGWDFDDFEMLAKRYNLFIPSMNVLNVKSIPHDFHSQNYDDFDEENIELIINYKCKLCKTSLNVGETPCWKCGTKDPTL